MNAICTQLRDPIDSGLTRWRTYGGENKWTPSRTSGGIPRVRTRFSLSVEMSRLTRDGTAEPVLHDRTLRREGGREIFIFPVQVATSKIGNHAWLIHILVCDDHTHVPSTPACYRDTQGSLQPRFRDLAPPLTWFSVRAPLATPCSVPEFSYCTLNRLPIYNGLILPSFLYSGVCRVLLSELFNSRTGI